MDKIKTTKSKINVNLWSGLRELTGGQDVITVEAATIGEMLAAITQKYPALDPVIEAGVSVSIDGRIIASSLRESVSADNEIFLLQQLKGG